MKQIKKIDDFLAENKKAFFKASSGKRLKLPRSKPRSRDEFIAIGRIVVEEIKKAERDGRFYYEPGKGLIIKWSN